MTAPHPSPTPAGSGSALDGDPRILIPLPAAAELHVVAEPPAMTAPPLATPPPRPLLNTNGIEALTRYVADATSVKVKRPSSPVVAWPGGPMKPFGKSGMSVTMAPATGAPLSSTTRPAMRKPGADCIVNTML